MGDFEHFLPMGTKGTKGSKNVEVGVIFKRFTLGVDTTRDALFTDSQSRTELYDSV